MTLWKDLDDLPEVHLGEVVMARKMEAGELDTTWFTRHGSTPVTAVSERWPVPRARAAS